MTSGLKWNSLLYLHTTTFLSRCLAQEHKNINTNIQTHTKTIQRQVHSQPSTKGSLTGLKWNSLLNHNNILVALPTRYISTQGRWRHQLLLYSVLVCSCICVYVNIQGVFLHSRPFKASTSPLKMCPRLTEKLFGPNLNPFFLQQLKRSVFYSMSHFTVFYSSNSPLYFYSSNSLCCILQHEKALLPVLPHLTQTLTHNGGG